MGQYYFFKYKKILKYREYFKFFESSGQAKPKSPGLEVMPDRRLGLVAMPDPYALA
jgi:hypothetical protein